MPSSHSGSDVEKADGNQHGAPAFATIDHSLTDDRAAAAHVHGHHERRDGRYVLDPEEARIEYGEEVASRLKLSKDRKYVLWPQP